MRKRGVKRVEYEPGWGWIARNPDGTEVIPDFRWVSRSVARDVAAQGERAALATPSNTGAPNHDQ